MPGGIPSSRYMRATTVPFRHGCAPLLTLHRTASPTWKRSVLSFLARCSGVTTQAVKSAFSSSCFRFLPMNTSLLSRGSSSSQGSMKSPANSMCTPWYTKRSSEWAMARTPFIRKISLPLFASRLPIHSCKRSMSSSPTWLMLRLDTVLSCWWSPSLSRNSGSMSRMRFRSKPLMPRTLSIDTEAFSHRITGANLLMPRMRPSILLSASSSPSSRSILLSSTRSAKAICSSASFSQPSGLEESSRCCSMCLASTRVTMPSRRANSLTLSSTKKV
mmetsp:Transcript_8500/g.24384  ORF Transcript_8500/g.24384 Transcript_8500/m.24384 type:complete len:274 (-) Transcript_8500:417-1238(-)